MSFGTTTQSISANRLTILRLAVEVTLTTDVKVRATRTVDRLNTRAGPIDTYRWLLEEVEFTAALTDLLLTQIKSDNNINAFQNMPFNNWTVAGISLSGSGGDDTSEVLSAALIDYEELGPETGTAQVRVKLRVAAGAT